MPVHDNVGRDDLAQWEWMIALSWSSPDNDDIPCKGPELVKNLKERAKDFGQPLRFCYESIPDDASAWHNRLSMWPTQEFDDRNGTVTIAGDAALKSQNFETTPSETVASDLSMINEALLNHNSSTQESAQVESILHTKMVSLRALPFKSAKHFQLPPVEA